VNVTGLMTMASFLKRFPAEKVINGGPGQAAATYENCTDCGECEEKCPYDLPIRETMPRSVEAFEDLRRAHAGP
jgi:predicted aldo/keto reductase-like oxidoreductase